MGKIASDRDHEIESLRFVRDDNRHAADTNAGGGVHEAAATDSAVRTGRKWSVEVLQVSSRRRYVECQYAMKTGAAIDKMPEQWLRRKRSRWVVKA